MGGRQLLDPRWHWLRNSLQQLYNELDPDASPVCLTLIAAPDEGQMISYTIGPDTGNEIDRRVITNLSALVDVAEATTVDASVDASVDS